MAYKYVATCQNCGRDVYGPIRARYLGQCKTCKRCRGRNPSTDYDAAAESERRYFERFDGGWQTDVQGFVSSP